MANVKLIFQGTEQSSTNEMGLQCYLNSNNEIFIKIVDYECDHGYGTQLICLDKQTAIKLHRELKKQISFIREEVNNG